MNVIVARLCTPFPLAVTILMLAFGCRNKETRIDPDTAFIPYIPAFTTGHISARSPILVRVSDDLVWRDTSAATLDKLFRIQPAVEGKVFRHDDRTFGFQPSPRFDQDRTYTVSFALGSVVELPGGLGDFKFQVTTFRQGIDVRVSDMRSLSPSDLTWQQLIVSVFTSDDATGQDLGSCFTVVQGGRTLDLTWEHEPNGRYHRFVADSVLRGDAASTVTITWNGRTIATDDAGSETFNVPAIGDLSLISSSTFSDGEQYALLQFSDPLDASQDLTGLVGIAGAEDLRVSIDGNRLMLYPRKRLSGDQQGYVSAALRNVNGRTLGKDITVDLTFEELKPAVQWVGKGTILPSSDGLVLPFKAVNLHSVEVRVIRINAANVSQFLQVNPLAGQREMARVGRLMSRTTLALNTPDAPDPGRWNTFHLDLAKLVRTEPGAIYRVQLSFGRKNSAYPCEGEAPGPERERTWEQEQADYDTYQERWYYYDDYEEYWEEDYHGNGNDRGSDPCQTSYYQKDRSISRNVLASDIGLIAKRGNDGSLLVAVSDLRSTAPLSGVKLEVLDLQRQVMASVVSDREGLVTIPPTRHRPFLLTASQGSQRGYLKLDDGSSLSVSEFDVQGEAVQKGLKGFLYGERGVWRPGDTLHLVFMLQDAMGRLPKDHPVVLELTDPRGRLDQKHVRTSGVDGMYLFRCTTSADAPTGYWNATVTVGGTTFHKSLRIETVKPNRIKLQLDLDTERLTAAASKEVTLQANWLHGAPARELRTRITVTATPGTARFKGLEKFTFDDLRTRVSEQEQVVFEDLLDATGRASFPLNIDLGRNAPAVVNANIVTRVFEAGGDASMDRVSVPYYPYSSYAGVRMPDISSPWGNLVTDTTYRFEVAAVDAQGKALAGHELKAQIYKLNWNWWWDGSTSGIANYITSPSVEIRKEETLRTDAKGRAVMPFRVDRPEWGRFAIRITDPASGHSAALQVHVDWPGWEGRSRRQGPEQAAMLSFNSDKERYNVGEQVVLTIPSSGSGRALVSLETGSRVLDAQWIELRDRETLHRFNVTADMAPNVYAHVTVVQPHANTLNDLPMRLYGVLPIFVEDPASRIQPVIALRSPTGAAIKEVRTDMPFEVEVSESDGNGMTYTLAIVDEGLLDLTRFRTPDPWKHFNAREALGVRTWDIYEEVIGAVGRQLQRVLALGGSDEGGKGDAARANRFKPVVRHVGPFRLEPGKKARHSFSIGNYVGSVRVMVVATDGEKAYGNAEQAVPVRKPLMVLATMPRVLAPGELVDLPVTVFAMDPKVKDVQVKIEPNNLLVPEGPAERTVRFNAMGDQVVTFRVRVKEAVGVATVVVNASGAGERASERIELQVRLPDLPLTQVNEVVLSPGERWQHAPDAPGVAGTNSAYLEISTIPPVDMGRRLQYLIGYPHGCLEQTTSKAFPQLFMAQVMELPARTAQEMRSNVEAAIRRMSTFQRHDGSFNYWPGGDHYDNWTSIYAGHFLVEAAHQGFHVPPNMRSAWMASQQKTARGWNAQVPTGWSPSGTQLTQAYRLYVLALAKSPEVGAMNRLREQPGLALQARWMLAAAYAVIGQKKAADDLVRELDTTVPAYTEQSYTYGSDLRDEALIAEALFRLGATARAAGVVQRIAKRLSADNWYSTQSTAFGLMAVARLAELGTPGKGMEYELGLAGKNTRMFSEKAIARTDLPTPDGRASVTVNNVGRSMLYLRLVRTGTPMPGQARSTANGIAMTVDYQLMDGTPIDPERIEQGTDFVAVVQLTHPGHVAAYQQLALTQIFPSGWEIRNARLEGTETVSRSSPFTYQDVRDDRVMTYFHLWKGRTHTYKVLLNAAYTGRYYMPGPHCEAMYDHTINAREQGQWVQVVPLGRGATAEK